MVGGGHRRSRHRRRRDHGQSAATPTPPARWSRRLVEPDRRARPPVRDDGDADRRQPALLSGAGRIQVDAHCRRRRPAGRRAALWASTSATGSPASSSRVDRFPEYVERVCRQCRDYPEAASALRGVNASAVRVAGDGMLILSAAVPVQRYKQVLGALMLTRDNRAHRRLAARGAARHPEGVRGGGARRHRAAVALSRRHHRPADRAAGARRRRVRLAARKPAGIPDLGKRGDEIGDLRRPALDDRRAVAAHRTPSSASPPTSRTRSRIR